ncbi:hypothetical protein I552_10127 [Mycobacterium xenopi 3993]|nr:hypothetical protein I552_10127 [Mycobacterium xenopi 3993]
MRSRTTAVRAGEPDRTAPVTNAEFTAALAARSPAHPAGFAGFAVRAVLGELADELLCGQRAIPAVLERAGFGSTTTRLVRR